MAMTTLRERYEENGKAAAREAEKLRAQVGALIVAAERLEHEGRTWQSAAEMLERCETTYQIVVGYP